MRVRPLRVVVGLLHALLALLFARAADLCPGCSDDQAAGGACEDAKAACKRNMCNPMCLGGSFDVEVKVEGCSGWEGCKRLETEVKSPMVQGALRAQAIAHLCSEATKLCSVESVTPWVYNTGYGLSGLDALPLPTTSCSSTSVPDDERKARCDACKASVKAEVITGICPPASNPEHEDEDQYPTKAECKAFDNAGADCGEAVPKHSSYTTKCWSVEKEMEGAKGGFGSKAGELLCGCLGCCEDQTCPVVVVPNDEEATKGQTADTVGFEPTLKDAYEGERHWGKDEK